MTSLPSGHIQVYVPEQTCPYPHAKAWVSPTEQGQLQQMKVSFPKKAVQLPGSLGGWAPSTTEHKTLAESLFSYVSLIPTSIFLASAQRIFIAVFTWGSLEVCHTPMEHSSFIKLLHLLN